MEKFFYVFQDLLRKIRNFIVKVAWKLVHLPRLSISTIIQGPKSTSIRASLCGRPKQ